MVTPGFFEGMAIKVVSGRSFTDDDRSATRRVALINRAFAQRYLQNRDPLGAVVAYGFPKPDLKDPAVIVGVIDDVRYKTLTEAAEATLYVPQAQALYASTRLSVVVYRDGGSAETLIPHLRDALAQFDSSLIATYSTSDVIVGRTLWRQELGMSLMLVFGATALVLAAIGLYGVIAYAAAQRRTELATRMALGASVAQVFWLMMRDGQRLVTIGVVLGLVVAYVGGRLAAGSVFAMRADDPVVLLVASAVVAVVAGGATMIPAIRVSRQDPVSALRD